MADYVDVPSLKATLTLTGQTFADADIQSAATAASRAIDEMTHRHFYKDTADTTRIYDPLSCDEVLIDDLAVLTTLKCDFDGDGTFEQTWTENTDFVLAPYNADEDSRPWTCIQRHPRGRYYFQTFYPRAVQVVGKFGWPVIPAPVVEATTIIAATLMRRAREAPFGIVAMGLDGVAVRIGSSDPHVRLLVGPYCKGDQWSWDATGAYR